VPGAVIIVLVMVLALPVAIMVAGAIWSAVIGWSFGKGDGAPTEGETPAT
jgi:hypothetical protein